MKRMLVRGAAAMTGLCALAVVAPAQAATPPSNYLLCDGMPNNMTAGESAARLLGAVTLLGLFAPPPESANAGARKLGLDGVEACSALIDGEKKEGNPERRVALILARAIHYIEAKKYDEAIADVGLARDEAKAAGLMDNAYFLVTRGTAFDNIESAALIRKGDAAAAQAASLRTVEGVRYAMMPMLRTQSYTVWNRQPVPGMDRYLANMARLFPPMTFSYAARMEELGRFADSARMREALIAMNRARDPEFEGSMTLAQTGLILALAGNWDLAATRVAEAKANFEKRRDAGKPEGDEASYVEVLDLYHVLETWHQGDLKTARRLFSGRSQWVNVSFGAVLEINRRLRVGAAPDDLIGALAKTPDMLWDERRDAEQARRFAKDSDNKTLWTMIPPYFDAKTFEAASRDVWNVEKSKLLLPVKAKSDKPNPYELLFKPGWTLSVAQPAYLLHAALLARSRGQEGFVVLPLLTSSLFAMQIRTGNKGDPGMEEAFFLDARDVIDTLSPLIPSPEALKARAG